MNNSDLYFKSRRGRVSSYWTPMDNTCFSSILLSAQQIFHHKSRLHLMDAFQLKPLLQNVISLITQLHQYPSVETTRDESTPVEILVVWLLLVYILMIVCIHCSIITTLSQSRCNKKCICWRSYRGEMQIR